MPPFVGGFTWDRRSQRYRGPDGRFVSSSQIRSVLDRTLANTRDRIEDLAYQLQRGDVSIDQWLVEMRSAVKDVQLYSTALAKGGWAQMTQADFGRVGRIVRDQYVYLDRFVADIMAGYPLDGRFIRRASMYVESGRRTYYDVLDRLMVDRGFDQERSRLNPADHCDECVWQDRLGWQKIGDMIPIGERTCLSNCKCFKQYRNSTTGQVIAG